MNRDVQRYLDAVPTERKPLVNKLHELIVGLYPVANVDMSYRMPTYKAKDGWVAIANQKRPEQSARGQVKSDITAAAES